MPFLTRRLERHKLLAGSVDPQFENAARVLGLTEWELFFRVTLPMAWRGILAGVLDVIQVRYNLLERQAEERLFPAALRHGLGVIVRSPLLFGLLTGKFTRETRFSEDDHRHMNLSPEKLERYFAQLEALEPELDEERRRTGATRAQQALAFCLRHPACHTVIPGAKNPAQVAENVGAAQFI